MRFHLALAVVLAACGDNLPPPDVLSQLAALPGVHDVHEEPTQNAVFKYFVLRFEQPVDHDNPGGQTFLQKVSLLHRDTGRPLIVFTSGYWDYYADRTVELTGLLQANQISIEHRYFGDSRPDPTDWTKLTIEQMAADQHVIVSALHALYGGAFISAGGSKGGMTAIFHRRFYPEDVDGTVPYVAPISYGAPDPRYSSFVDSVGTDECRQAVRDVAVEMLANRRAALTLRAQDQAVAESYAYTRIALGPAVESAVFSVEWSFWQYYGITYCSTVPTTTASDDDMFTFLDEVSPVSDNNDVRIGQFDAYYYQAYFQLGYPDDGAAYLQPYLIYSDADYVGELPTAEPAYDGGAAMFDIDQFVRTRGDRLLFIYGEWDPWTAGKFELGDATDSLRLIQAMGTHGSRISRLAAADRDAALAKLAAWTGVTPTTSTARAAGEPTLPRPPSAFIRGLRARRGSP